MLHRTPTSSALLVSPIAWLRVTELGLLHVMALTTFLVWTAAAELTSFANFSIASTSPAKCLFSGLAEYKFSHAGPWEPLLWFRLATAVYYGFGALVPYLASHKSGVYARTVWPFSDEDIAHVNFVCISSAAVVLTTVFLLEHLLSPIIDLLVDGRTHRPPDPKLLIAATLSIGILIQMFIDLPYKFGFMDGMPSFLRHARYVLYVGLHLAWLQVLFQKRLFVLTIGITFLEITVSLLTFSKQEVLLVLLMCLTSSLASFQKYYAVPYRFYGTSECLYKRGPSSRLRA